MTSDLPPPGPGDFAVEEPAPRRSRQPRRPRRSASEATPPNYTARRVAVGSVALALVAAVALVLTSVIGSDDEDPAVIEPGWDTILEIDRSSGSITGLDADGDEVVTVDGAGRPSALHVRGDRLAVVGTGAVQLVGLDGSEATVVEFDRSSRAVRHPSNRSFVLVIAPEIGGEILVVDAASGSTTALGERAGQAQPLLLPETLRADRDGTRFAVGDGRNFQTIVVDVDPDTEPTFFPGVPMSLDPDVVVTSTNVGQNAELGMFAPDGTRLATVQTPRPVAGVLVDGRFVYVTEDGRLLAASVDQDEPDEVADLALPTVDMVVPLLDRTRLLVTSNRRVLVVDLDGEVVHDDDLTPGDTPLDDLTPWSTWNCLPIMRSDGGVVVDLHDGAVTTELPAGEMVSTTADGCGVHVRTTDDSDDALDATDSDAGEVRDVDDARDVIVTPSGRFSPRTPVREIVLSPDGTAALVVAPDGNVELVTIDDGRRLDLGVRRGLLSFAQR